MPGPTISPPEDAPAVTEDLNAPPEQVFDVLLAPTTYPSWLVGAEHIRSVDDDWPEPGSAFHHTVGMGPFHVRDRTTVVSCDRPRSLELCVHAGPLGAAFVRFELIPFDGGTRLRMWEQPRSGAMRMLWQIGAKPLVQAIIWGRNHVSMDELRALLAPTEP